MHPKSLSPDTHNEGLRLAHRLQAVGPAALSDAELLAILAGGPEPRTLPAMRALLLSLQGDLWRIARCGFTELMNNHGLTRRQCAVLLAALNLAHRRRDTPPHERSWVTTSAHAYELLRTALADLPHEEFWLLLLDRGNRLLAQVRTSIGGLSGTVADPKVIFKQALDHRASSLILAHNHPSGQLRPSEEDMRLTKRLCAVGQAMDLPVQDHLIVGLTGYFSFSDNGMLV